MSRNDALPDTERMLFRRFTLDDVQFLHDLDSDPEVMRYLSRESTPYEVIRDETLPRILQMAGRYPRLGRWAAFDRESGSFLGWFALDVDRPDMRTRPELGYRLKREAWGRGLATEGSRALIDHAFRRSGVDAVFAQTMAVNLRSRRVMEKLGMRHIRTFHAHFEDPLPGVEQGEVEYEITRQEWALQQARKNEEG